MIPSLLAPFVGRAEELLVLGDAFGAAAAGQFVPVLVGGEAGVGKTRLVTEFVASLGPETVVHWGRCVEEGIAPFWSWTQVLRSLTGDDRAVSWDSGGDRYVSFAAVAALLRELAQQPTVIVFDDLHVADIGSLELTRFLVRAVADVPVLLIGTHREHELRADPERDMILGDLARFGRRLNPPPLGRGEVGALLEGIVGATVPPAVVDAVLDRTAGNALFVDETARVLASTGFASIDVMPEGLRAAVRTRLCALPPACRELLSAASVLGSECDGPVLSALLAVTDAELAERLEPALAIGVISVLADGRLAFSHSLVRDAIYEDLSPWKRASWHERSASTLRSVQGDRCDAHIASIAQHYAAATLVAGVAPSADWASRAAEIARSARAHEAAAEWSDRAAARFEALGRLDEQAEELARAADDLGAVGHNDASGERARKVTELARQTGSGELLARAARCRAAVFGPVRKREAPALLREALDHPDNAGSTRGRAELLGALASLLGVPAADGRSPDAAAARAARSELEELVADGVEARDLVLDALLSTEHGPEHYALRPGWLEEYTQLGHLSPDPLGWRIKRSYWAASVAFERGGLHALRQDLDDWTHVAEVLGVRYWDWRLAIARASEAFAHGRLVEAEERARASLDLGGDLYQELTVGVSGAVIIGVRHEQGRLADLVKDWPIDDLGVVAMLLHIERGDTAAVAALLARHRPEMERSEHDLYWLCVTSFLARGAAYLQDRAACQEMLDQLEPFADQFIVFGRCALFGGPVAGVVADVAAGAGHPELAETHLRSALSWAEVEDAPGFATRTRFSLATLLAEPGGSRQHEREQLLRQVIEVGSRLGMDRVVADAELSLDGTNAVIALDPRPDQHVPKPAIRTFGGFAVLPAGADEPVRWTSKKARDTLKFLVARRGAAVTREELIDLLWPDDTDPTRGRSRLSVVLSMVRSALDPDRRWPTDRFLRADREAVALRTEHVDIDLDRFLALAATGLDQLRSGSDQARTSLEQALELVHGGFLIEDVYADWPAATRSEVSATYTAVLRALAEAADQEGDHRTLVLRLSQLVDQDPYDDVAHRELVEALTAGGRRTDAERQQARHAARQGELDLR